MAIMLTGDTHGDFTRFQDGMFQDRDAWSKDDYMIICGDFGGVWNESPAQKHNLDWLDALPFTVLFVTGNHENYDLLSAYPLSVWHGGTVRFIRPSVILLSRGQVFNLQGRTFFTMGGASCHDVQDGILEPDDPLFQVKYKRLMRRSAYFRVNHLSWWKEEMPSPAEYETARRNLSRCGWTVDYIVTHCAPTSIQKIVGHWSHEQNELTDFFEEVSQQCAFRLWFFGHYHHNLCVRQKYYLLYDQIISLKETM